MMQLQNSPLKRAALLALLPMLLLTGCAPKQIGAIKPPVERVTPIAYPAIPDGRVTCPHDPQAQCLDDEQTARVITSFADALDAANAKLRWLRDYYAALPD